MLVGVGLHRQQECGCFAESRTDLLGRVHQQLDPVGDLPTQQGAGYRGEGVALLELRQLGLHAGGIVHPGRLQRLGRGVECGLQVVRRRPEGLAFLRRLQLSTEIGELVERAVGACVEHLMQLVAGLDARGVRVADGVAV